MSLPTECPLLQIEMVEDVARVSLKQKTLDETNIHTIGDQLFRLIDELGRRKLHLDFSKVELVSSSGLGKLVALHKKLQAVGGHLTLYNLRERTYEVFEITRLDTLLDIRGSKRGVGAA
jgi:anti-sigma B factor antagonist